MRILGIDYGTKKIGLAISDTEGKIAFPFKILRLTTYDVVNLEIKKICQEKEIGEIVLGKPDGYKGDSFGISGKVEEFKQQLSKEIDLPIIYESEILTTKQAERSARGIDIKVPVANLKKNWKKPIQNMDASAAALILQSYLDKNN
ncbi:MAG: Holliday junction resolvase RuvX [Patescibacteria group bacterium]